MKWEYMSVETARDGIDQLLSDLGDEGWEAYHIYHEGDHRCVYFKRPLK